jgi:sec-independent protein translocase protein TatA
VSVLRQRFDLLFFVTITNLTIALQEKASSDSFIFAITMKGLAVIFLALFVSSAVAFVSPKNAFLTQYRPPSLTKAPFVHQPGAVQRARKSVASVQTMSLFGLGPAEIAIILIAGAFLLGPQKLAELGRDAGKIAGELKEVPKEFQEGLKEGEAKATEIKKELKAQETEKQE